MIPRLADLPKSTPIYLHFLDELRGCGFEGDLSTGYADRTVLATDNSIYQLTPQVIAFPRNEDDLVRIARLTGDPRFEIIKLAPRGGGTGTNGHSAWLWCRHPTPPQWPHRPARDGTRAGTRACPASRPQGGG